MGYFGKKQGAWYGFTVVELLIVITVIGLLVAVVAVAYPSYQKRTLDQERKSDVQQIAAAFDAYVLQRNNFVETGSGCGINGNGNGWFNAITSDIATYPHAISDCMQDAKVLAGGIIADPSGCRWGSGTATCGSTLARAYMKVTCTKSSNKVTYVMAYLETEPQKKAEVDALCDAGTVSGFTSTTQRWGTAHGMNYYVLVN